MKYKYKYIVNQAKQFNKMKIFSGSSNQKLAKKIADDLGLELSALDIHVFPDGEKRIRVVDRVIDEDCVVVQSTSTSANENYMELFFILDALGRSGAKSITAVVPYLGYQRQDHIFRDGEAVSLEVIIKIMETAGLNKLITFDLHSIKIPELFSIPVVHLSALPIFAKKIKELIGIRQSRVEDDARLGYFEKPTVPRSLSESLLKNNNLKSDKSQTAFSSSSSELTHPDGTILVSPDMGGIRRIKILSEMLGNMRYVSLIKNRNLKTGKVRSNRVESEFPDWKKGIKKAVIVDDMISTGATIKEAVNLLIKKGIKEIFVFATHPVLSNDYKNILQNSKATKIFVTDTVDIPKEKMFGKLEILSVAETIAEDLGN